MKIILDGGKHTTDISCTGLEAGRSTPTIQKNMF
jgi:hypothetical protein